MWSNPLRLIVILSGAQRSRRIPWHHLSGSAPGFLDFARNDESLRRETQYFRDGTKSIITRNTSPDVGFETSLNPYRGCEHGCIYCYARPTHEYLGFSAGLDFESKIVVKTNAPELLRAELESPRWQPQTLVTERRDGSVSAGRAKIADHTRLP